MKTLKHPNRVMKAVCWASGRIDLVERKPKGSLLIAKGPRRRLMAALQLRARMAFDGKTMLVPGVPEAKEMEIDPVEAVIYFSKCVTRALGKAKHRKEGK